MTVNRRKQLVYIDKNTRFRLLAKSSTVFDSRIRASYAVHELGRAVSAAETGKIALRACRAQSNHGAMTVVTDEFRIAFK